MAEIRCLVNQSCEISKHQPAVLDNNRVHFFQDMESTVALMAHHLARRGLGEGDRVAMLMRPSWPSVCTVFALIRIKAIAVPLSPRLPVEALKSHLAAVQAHTLITEPGLHPEELDGVDILHAEEIADYVALDRRIIPYHDTSQPAVIVFTSGTSGHPKPAMLTYGNLYYSAQHSNTNLHFSSHHKWLLSIPLYHVGGLGILFRCVEGGGTVVIPTPDVPLSRDVQSYKVTHLSLVPTQLIRLMQAADAKKTARSLHTVLLGGAPISTEQVQQALALGFPVRVTYGMTETSSQVATHPKYISEDKLHTAGRVLPCSEVFIAEDGEIYVRGRTLFAGYIEGDKTVSPIDTEGWYHTGDIGALDEAGYLTVLGRKDNRFTSGGENIYPEEIEGILIGRLNVDKAIVVPVPDETFGQRPVAFVAFPSGITAAHLAHQLEEFLPRFKIPVVFHDWPPDAPDKLKSDRIWFQSFINQQ